MLKHRLIAILDNRGAQKPTIIFLAKMSSAVRAEKADDL
jgi:hypothetical protein